MKRIGFAFALIAFFSVFLGLAGFAFAQSQSACYADLTYSGSVDDGDQGPLKANFGKSSLQSSCSWNGNSGISCQAFDANRDGVIDERDNSAIGYYYGSSCSAVSFYDYNKDFYLNNGDLQAIDNNLGKSASQACSVNGQSVSCSSIDGNKDGVIRADDKFGVLVNWLAFVGSRPDLTVASMNVSTLPAEVSQLEKVSVTVRNSRNVGFNVFDSSRNPVEKIFVWLDEEPFFDADDQA